MYKCINKQTFARKSNSDVNRFNCISRTRAEGQYVQISVKWKASNIVWYIKLGTSKVMNESVIDALIIDMLTFYILLAKVRVNEIDIEGIVISRKDTEFTVLD